MSKMRNKTSLLKNSTLTSILAVLGLVASVASTPAYAAKFGVKIVNEAGQAVEGAAVCAGLPGNSTQFGSSLTDASGLAMLEVPSVPFVVKVSKHRVGAMKINEPARGFNLIKQITLKQNSVGTKCFVEGLETSQSSVRISNVEVTDNVFTTTLKPTVIGEPTQYRVSRSSTFNGAKWKRFETSIPLSASLSEEDEVYIQIRRYKSVNKSWIEARSDVVNVKLPAFE